MFSCSFLIPSDESIFGPHTQTKCCLAGTVMKEVHPKSEMAANVVVSQAKVA